MKRVLIHGVGTQSIAALKAIKLAATQDMGLRRLSTPIYNYTPEVITIYNHTSNGALIEHHV